MHFGLQSLSQMLGTARDGVPSFLFAWALIAAAWLIWRTGGLFGIWRAIFRVFGKVDDLVLAQGLSFLTGTHWKVLGKRWADWLAWAQLVCVSAIVAVGVAILPLGWAIGAMFAGLLLILGVLRDWSKSERQREELVALGIHRNMLWEAVFAASLLFLLAPMGLSRIDNTLHLFPNPRGPMIVDMFRIYLGRAAGFTWGEVPHSIPIVHALAPEGNAFGATGKKVVETCAAILRVVYELMVVAVFVEVLGIGRRIAAQEDLRPLQRDVTLGSPSRQRRAIAILSKLALGGRRDASDLLETATEDSSEDRPRPVEVRYEAISALYAAAARFRRRIELEVVIHRLQELVRGLDESRQGELWTNAQTLLGVAWQTLGDIVGGAASKAYLDSALEAFEAAMRGFPPSASSSAYAELQSRCAAILTRLGDLSQGDIRAGYLEQAAQALEVALNIYSSENDHRRADKLSSEISDLRARLDELPAIAA